MSDPTPPPDPDAARVTELAAELTRLRERYYAGEPENDDATYDALEDELRGLLEAHPELTPADNPLERVGSAPPSGSRRAIRHASPMLSLAKVSPDAREDGVREFAERFPGQPLRVTPKLDGVSLSLVYVDGALEHVATRGDGTTGEEVTAATQAVVTNLPAALLGTAGRVEVRGEAVMLGSVFAAYNASHPDKPLANPRNACAGTLMQKDPAAAAAAGRVLHLFAFDAVGVPVGELAALGFAVPEIAVVTGADAVLEVIAGIEAGATDQRLRHRRRGRAPRRRARLRRRRQPGEHAARRGRDQAGRRGARDDPAGHRLAGRPRRQGRSRGRCSSRSPSAAPRSPARRSPTRRSSVPAG